MFGATGGYVLRNKRALGTYGDMLLKNAGFMLLLNLYFGSRRGSGIDKDMTDFAARYLAHHWGAVWWQLIECILGYLSSTYLTVLVINDFLVQVLKTRTLDGVYHDPSGEQYKQAQKLVALLGPQPQVMEVPMANLVTSTADAKPGGTKSVNRDHDAIIQRT